MSALIELLDAIERGNQDEAIRFIDEGADVKAEDWPEKRTPLHFAAMAGLSEVCFKLIEKGADAHESPQIKWQRKCPPKSVVEPVIH